MELIYCKIWVCLFFEYVSTKGVLRHHIFLIYFNQICLGHFREKYKNFWNVRPNELRMVFNTYLTYFTYFVLLVLLLNFFPLSIITPKVETFIM